MFIQKTCYSPAFKADFVNNKEFREVVKYAQENNCMRTLDGALNNIKKANIKIIIITLVFALLFAFIQKLLYNIHRC